ncbi:MAG TPA: hypothetical protein VIM19_02145 [Actinomycetes bacterium]
MLGRTRTAGKSTTWLATFCGGIAASGSVIIVIYGLASSTNRAEAISTGLLTALASYLTGFLLGFLFGIPRYVSSGEFRLSQKPSVPVGPSGGTVPSSSTAKVASGGTVTATPDQPSDQENVVAMDRADRPSSAFTPSTNLAEVSDWLTKLLLGAGLVQLTHLGAPVASLINSVASGLEGGTTTEPSGSATVIAGAILITYTVLGFLVGYVLTTLWYGHRLAQSGLADG